MEEEWRLYGMEGGGDLYDIGGGNLYDMEKEIRMIDLEEEYVL